MFKKLADQRKQITKRFQEINTILTNTSNSVVNQIMLVIKQHSIGGFMNKHAFLSIITVVLLGFSLVNHASGQEAAKEETGKTSAKEVQQKLNEAAEAIKNYSADKRDEAANKTKVALDALDNRIVALERELDKNWDKMNQAAREQSRKTLKALHEQRVKVAEWYGGFKNSSESAWEEMKKGFSEAYKALHQAWLEAEHEYEKEERRSR